MAIKCIICGNDKKGTPVSDDLIIRSIRRVKQTLNIAQNNKLVVCRKCMPEHLKRRENFEKRVVRYGAIGVIIAIVLLLLLQTWNSLVAGALIVILMLSFTITGYHPSLVSYPGEEKKKARNK